MTEQIENDKFNQQKYHLNQQRISELEAQLKSSQLLLAKKDNRVSSQVTHLYDIDQEDENAESDEDKKSDNENLPFEQEQLFEARPSEMMIADDRELYNSEQVGE